MTEALSIPRASSLRPVPEAFWKSLGLFNISRMVLAGVLLAAILLYLGSGLTHVTPWAMGQGGEVADAAGHIGRLAPPIQASSTRLSSSISSCRCASGGH